MDTCDVSDIDCNYLGALEAHCSVLKQHNLHLSLQSYSFIIYLATVSIKIVGSRDRSRSHCSNYIVSKKKDLLIINSKLETP